VAPYTTTLLNASEAVIEVDAAEVETFPADAPAEVSRYTSYVESPKEDVTTYVPTGKSCDSVVVVYPDEPTLMIKSLLAADELDPALEIAAGIC
jgi:hypothetical protein